MTTNSQRFAFIVGHYKSGSTWLAHMLALHEAIRVVSETHVFRYSLERENFEVATEELFTESAWGAGGLGRFPRYWAAKYSRPFRVALGMAKGTSSLPPTQVPTTVHDIGYFGQARLKNRINKAQSPTEYCQAFFEGLLAKLNPSGYLVEKTPTNIFYVDAIRDAFPESKLISIYRDGRDVVVSDMHHLKRAYGKEKPFDSRVQNWVKAMRQQIAVAEANDIHCLSYEDLKVDPQTCLANVLEHLKLETSQSDMDDMIRGSSFEAMSGGRKAGEENTSKFHRKGVVGDWVNVFSDEEKQIFSDLAGELLVELGYEKSPDWKDWLD